MKTTGYTTKVEFWGNGGGFVIDFTDQFGNEVYWTFDRNGNISHQVIS